MQATRPAVDVPGDNDERIMARSGTCLGMSDNFAVWRFGFRSTSPRAQETGVSIPDENCFMWILATRKTGKVKDFWYGAALDMPKIFRKVIEWEPN